MVEKNSATFSLFMCCLPNCLLGCGSQVGCGRHRQAVDGRDGEGAIERVDHVRGGEADDHVAGAVHGEVGTGCRDLAVAGASDREAG